MAVCGWGWGSMGGLCPIFCPPSKFSTPLLLSPPPISPLRRTMLISLLPHTHAHTGRHDSGLPPWTHESPVNGPGLYSPPSYFLWGPSVLCPCSPPLRSVCASTCSPSFHELFPLSPHRTLYASPISYPVLAIFLYPRSKH
jgi:hypothetical protein